MVHHAAKLGVGLVDIVERTLHRLDLARAEATGRTALPSRKSCPFSKIQHSSAPRASGHESQAVSPGHYRMLARNCFPQWINVFGDLARTVWSPVLSGGRCHESANVRRINGRAYIYMHSSSGARAGRRRRHARRGGFGGNGRRQTGWRERRRPDDAEHGLGCDVVAVRNGFADGRCVSGGRIVDTLDARRVVTFVNAGRAVGARRSFGPLSAGWALDAVDALASASSLPTTPG